MRLFVKLPEASDKAVEKNCQGRIAEKTRMASGTCDGDPTWASRRKATKTSIAMSGRMRAHTIPITVCL